MSKPILVIRFPHNIIKIEEFDTVIKNLEKKIDDYHVLPVIDNYTGAQIKFECFNSPHTEIEFEELKRRVLESIMSYDKVEDGILGMSDYMKMGGVTLL